MKVHVVSTLSKLVIVAALTIGLAGAATVQAAAFPNQITIRNQDVRATGIAIASSVSANQDGWLVIYRNSDLSSSEVVGYAPVHQGLNMGVKVVVSLPLISDRPMLFAVLQADNGVPGLFEYGIGNRGLVDGPVSQNGRLITATFATTSSPAAAQQTGSQTAASANRITIHDQDITSGIVLADSVTAAQDGWLVIYREPNFGSGAIVGFAPVYQGVNSNVRVAIDTSKITDQHTLWAQLHTDSGLLGVFEWGYQGQPFNDYPAVQNNKYTTASFGTTPSPAPAPATSAAAQKLDKIIVHSQALNTGVIMIDSVTAAQNGWVVIYREPTFGAGEIVGYAPVYKGTNLGIPVTIDTTKISDNQPTLWAVLHVDSGLQNIFEWGFKGRVYADPPVFRNGAYVAASFGTVGR